MRTIRMILLVVSVSMFVAPYSIPIASAADALTKAQAEAALRKAVDFFRKDVSGHGGYVWRYSVDLSLREGESKATASMGWVQPPGTPDVGEAFLTAYQLTRDNYYLDAAKETARALIQCQLPSGGWEYSLEFDPAKRWSEYRVSPGTRSGKPVTTLDDDNTQSVVRFLMHLDEELKFGDAAVHEATLFALDALVKAQYPVGAWPQRYREFPDPAKHPVKPANYPESWPRTFPKKDYTGYYTLNDDTLADMVGVMFEAARIYGDDRYSQSARRGGDFLVLAQMPDPQPGWAQQYNPQMQPDWARKFEPPSITGGESQGALRTLLLIFRHTGDKKYLAPFPRALAYYRKSLLPDGRLARFYELQTNKPLYFTKTYELTYSTDDLPTHYGFIVSSGLDALETEWKRLAELPTDQLLPKRSGPRPPKLRPALTAKAQDIVGRLDARGAWVQEGMLRYHEKGPDRIIDTAHFIENVRTLAQFIGASGD